jgi:hypothetical protein
MVRASLAALAGRLGLEAAASAGIEGAEAAVLDALRKGEPHRRWLLIFDNADQPEDLNETIPRGRAGDNPLYHPVNVSARRYHPGHAR